MWFGWNKETDQIFPLENPEDLRIWFDGPLARRVAFTEVGPYRVSTVFLAMDHGFGGPALFFETMIFSDPNSFSESYCDRYATAAEARAGHKEAVLMAEQWYARDSMPKWKKFLYSIPEIFRGAER